jgi:hypothetical protein
MYREADLRIRTTLFRSGLRPSMGVLVFAIIEHLRPSSLHFNPTAQRTYRVCGWELTGASKDPYPGQVDAKLHDRLCAHAMGTWAVVNLARGWRQACFLLQQACWSFT